MKKPTRLLLTALSTVLVWGAAQAQALKIGASAGVHADTLDAAAREARKQGLDVKVIEFTDWTTPNAALAAGDLDANYFQHQAFLDNAIKERGYKFAVAGVGVLPNIGLFSYRIKNFGELKDGAKVGVASDPVNQGRGLALLEQAGLIKLRPGLGQRGTVNDITANPRKLKIVEVEGPQLVRAIDDLDLAQGIPAHFVSAGKPQMASNGLLYSGASDVYFAIRFVTRQDNANDPRIRKFVQIFQESQAVRDRVHQLFGNDAKLYSLPWLNK
ncbi:MetQ/NlpA family ABC transporter substrate-binding protein [Azohydromonas caseinilytica]|uniref:MetQ/NlpA family ABC transporter substrate-binding protein n=1 Tax=Azohydromonas caseinilytica TaxID=2728836 RepID=A0A848FM61_9BURK|nr:MetQ/NlpA family ABC transporter substrate-binding protein [Azohydromonas caseinilytica]NML18861.1 MetQ/NlpA family ABC transporter substrate-binding protein [Azohydromonas caseinilytica]